MRLTAMLILPCAVACAGDIVPSPLATDLTGQWTVTYYNVSAAELVAAGLPNQAPRLELTHDGEDLVGRMIFPATSTGGPFAAQTVELEGWMNGNSYTLANDDVGLAIGGHFDSHFVINITMRLDDDDDRPRVSTKATRTTAVPPDRPLDEYLGDWRVEVLWGSGQGRTALRLVLPTGQFPDAVLELEWALERTPIRLVRDHILRQDDDDGSILDFRTTPATARMSVPSDEDPPTFGGTLHRPGATP